MGERKYEILNAKQAIKNKQPSNEFLTQHPYIIVSKFNLQDKQLIEIYSSFNRYFYIDNKDFDKLKAFTEHLINCKTKSEMKHERKMRTLSQQIKKNYQFFKEILLSKPDILDLLSINENIKDKNIKFLFKAFTIKISEETIEKKEHRILKEQIEKEIKSFLSDFNWSSSLTEYLKNSDTDVEICQIKSVNQNPLLVFTDVFEKEIVLYVSTRFFNKTIDIKKKASMKIGDRNVYSNINVKYDSDYLNSCSIKEIIELKDLSILSELENISLTEQDIEDFIRSRFERTIEDISLLSNDKLLKESFYPDFKRKLGNVKKITANSNFRVKDAKWTVSDLIRQAKNSSMIQFFEVKEKRINGFKRSINRRIIQKKLDVENFKDLFPCARNRKRNLIYIQGETNSGKTYTAFEMAKEKESGIYAAPLRLLALEGQQEFKKRGVSCSMITGEEREEVEGARFISSTVEMIDYSKEYDIAIIDEVQLINDLDRGHAWLEAIVGVNAKTVILVGSKDIEPVITDLADYLNEPLEIQSFSRKTKLKFDKNLFERSMSELGKLPPHSAVVAFSKKDVLDLKIRFEKLGNKVSVIYGALPPQVRRIETERFVNGETDVVIATDAIGMGLNLPIENVFFSKKEKFDGRTVGEIDPALVKQIVGRAGRYLKFETGYVSALSSDVFNYINKAFKKNTVVENKELRCSPNYLIIKQIQELTNDDSIYKLLQNYNNSINFDFEIKNHMNEYSYMFSRFLDETSESRDEQLSLLEKVKLVNAPVSMDRGYKMMDFYKACIKNIYELRDNPDIHPISLVYDKVDTLPFETLSQNEMSIKKIDLLSWLSFNFEEFKCISDDLATKRNKLNKTLVKHLRNSTSTEI